MRQLVQNVSSGDIAVEEVPAPARGPAQMLVATRYSVISAGTERAVMQIGRASLAGKARQRPDLVKKVLDTAKEEGVAATYAKVRGRLDEPNPLGYSLSGVVIESCDGAPAGPGELVACGGAGYASHAEVVAVPKLLTARVPDGVDPQDAAHATIAAIALHGVRLTGVGLGDVAAVIGLGLVGQITLELLRAAGCVALGIDPDPSRAQLARDAGFFATTDQQELEAEALRLTERRGADGVLVTAAAKSSAPLATAIDVARERCTVCIVGDVQIETPRAPMFAKEIKLVVSRSYGPGRYDPSYEESGIDYPAGYVRWTEGRNLDEVLRLMSTGQLNPSRLLTHTFELEQGPEAYELLDADEPSLGILLRYPGRDDAGPRSVTLPAGGDSLRKRLKRDRPRLGVVGAGAFARSVLLPPLAREADITAIATATGLSARASATRFGAQLATTDAEEVLTHPDVDAVVIATRHDTHAAYAALALRSGKHVFVEKPLALDEHGLRDVEAAAAESGATLTVGYNRRFAPQVVRIKDELAGRGPLMITYRVNAGRLQRSHWSHDPQVGGGRIVGEGCHFVDVATYLAGAAPEHMSTVALSGGVSEPREDAVATTLAFPDGSVAQIVYSALGDASLAKERLEVLGEAGAAVLDDFRELSLHKGGRATVEQGKRNKGHRAELAAFLEACRSGRQPWPVAEMAAVTRATFAMRDAVAPPA